MLSSLENLALRVFAHVFACACVLTSQTVINEVNHSGTTAQDGFINCNSHPEPRAFFFMGVPQEAVLIRSRASDTFLHGAALNAVCLQMPLFFIL